jgi:putative ABC transport system substrate-binding protein
MKQRLPAIHEWKSFAQAGGLITNGADISDIYRRAAGFADKILKGAKPTDLPVEMPIRIEMAVNLKSAKAIGVTVPDSILKEAIQIS